MAEVIKSSESAPKADSIVIHVCDENRKINRDFVCTKDTLLKEMKYFRNYLSGSNNYDDIDISVHCDVHIFEWLMDYVNNPDRKPIFDCSSVISILISSEFLEMERLVAECLGFVHGHLNDIIKMPIDLNCLNDKLLKQLADMMNDEDFETLKDKKDKLSSKIYMRKLESMFQNGENAVYQCVHCDSLFTKEQQPFFTCPKAPSFVDFHGHITSVHTPKANFSLTKFMQGLRSQKMSWKQLYWRMWGITHMFKCTTCGVYFSGVTFSHCAFHSQEAKFRPSENVGHHRCCGLKTTRFDAAGSRTPTGCLAREHVLAPDTNKTSKRCLQQWKQLITIPFQPFQNYIDPMSIDCDSDCSEDDTFNIQDPVKQMMAKSTCSLLNSKVNLPPPPPEILRQNQQRIRHWKELHLQESDGKRMAELGLQLKQMRSKRSKHGISKSRASTMKKK